MFSKSIIVLLVAACAQCAGRTAAPEPTTETPAAPLEAAAEPDPERNDTDEWSGLVDCDYGASHGWGHVYQCQVRQARSGTPSSPEFSLNVAVGEDWLPENEQTPLRGKLMRFRPSERPYGPPSGYRDPQTSVYWVLVSAAPEPR